MIATPCAKRTGCRRIVESTWTRRVKVAIWINIRLILPRGPANAMHRAGVTRVLVLGALIMQLAVLLAYSYRLYSHFDLTMDFAVFHQAWYEIAHGNLNPENTIFYRYPYTGYPFWRNHFELVMWPLALSGVLFSHSMILLAAQDVGIVGTEFLVLEWIGDIVASHEQRAGTSKSYILIGSLLSLLVNPWIYETASFDFHFETLAAPFLVLAARALWNRRFVQAWSWAGICLLFGGVVATYVVGLGISGMLSNRTRRAAWVLLAMGMGWLGMVVGIGGEMGSNLASSYGYLAHLTDPRGIGAILWGIVTHPGTVVHVLAQRRQALWQFIISEGGFGAVAPWGVGVTAAVLLANGLNVSPNFLSAAASFQNFVVFPFVLVGSVTVVLEVMRRGGSRLGLGIGVFLLGAAFMMDRSVLPGVPSEWLLVNNQAAYQLMRIHNRVPPQTEVIASQGVIGRFAGRPFAFAQFMPNQQFPVLSHDILFVLVPRQGIEAVSPSATMAVVTALKHKLHAKEVVAQAGVYAFEWRPPRGVKWIALP